MSNNCSFLFMKMKRKFKVIFSLIVATPVLIVIIGLGTYMNNIGSLNSDTKIIHFVVENGDTYTSVSEKLEEGKIIKSAFFFKVYTKLHNTEDLLAGDYELSSSMNVEEVLNKLAIGPASPDQLLVTFNEGLNMRQMAKIMEDNSNITTEEVFALMKDEEYLNTLINKYWFITDEILEEEIYYSLEGYLFPDSYMIETDNIDVKGMFSIMIDEMDDKLTPLKKQFEDNDLSIHEVLTLASIVELEGLNEIDRKDIAAVFSNRLKYNYSLGSDVTTYYSAKINVGERDLYVSELAAFDYYNTRNIKMAGVLPISPICNSSFASIEAALNPSDAEYLYFVADKNGKVYFTNSNSEHIAIINKLKAQGLWFIWE